MPLITGAPRSVLLQDYTPRITPTSPARYSQVQTGSNVKSTLNTLPSVAASSKVTASSRGSLGSLGSLNSVVAGVAATVAPAVTTAKTVAATAQATAAAATQAPSNAKPAADVDTAKNVNSPTNLATGAPASSTGSLGSQFSLSAVAAGFAASAAAAATAAKSVAAVAVNTFDAKAAVDAVNAKAAAEADTAKRAERSADYARHDVFEPFDPTQYLLGLMDSESSQNPQNSKTSDSHGNKPATHAVAINSNFSNDISKTPIFGIGKKHPDTTTGEATESIPRRGLSRFSKTSPQKKLETFRNPEPDERRPSRHRVQKKNPAYAEQTLIEIAPTPDMSTTRTERSPDDWIRLRKDYA